MTTSPAAPTSSTARPRTAPDSAPRLVGPCLCGAPEDHTDRPPYGEAVRGLCPARTDLTPEQRGAVERTMGRRRVRREAAEYVARMDPREVARLRREGEEARAEAAFIFTHTRPGHMCLDCSQGL